MLPLYETWIGSCPTGSALVLESDTCHVGAGGVACPGTVFPSLKVTVPFGR